MISRAETFTFDQSIQFFNFKMQLLLYFMDQSIQYCQPMHFCQQCIFVASAKLLIITASPDTSILILIQFVLVMEV